MGGGIAGEAFASPIAYIIATVVVIIAFVIVSKKFWTDILMIKKQDFRDYYKEFIFKIRLIFLNKV